MIEYKTGDLLSEDVEALVNTVNCVGVMGRGMAAQFKGAWPANFRAYAAACKRGEVQPGRMFVVATGNVVGPRFIVNFPTKRLWKGKLSLADIRAGLVALVAEVRERGIRSIAVPPLGAGLGGLDWQAVRQLIESALGTLADVRVIVFEPSAAPSKLRTSDELSRVQMTPGRAALVGLMHRYLRGLLDPTVSLLEVHKLMYFMQEAGEDLRLEFKPAKYGPYAENLRHVLRKIEGSFVTGYGDGGDEPDKPLDLLPGAIEEAQEVLAERRDTGERFERVADLVAGFESSFGLELLATVHWLLTRDGVAADETLVERTHAWDPRKRKLSPRQIFLARDVLREKGFVAAS